MENASKALIMAGAVLIAIMIVTIGVYLVGELGKTSESYVQQLDTVELQKYNSNFEVFIDEKDDIPILLFDDIMSELDSKRINFLLKYIENYQSIITTTDASFVKDVKDIVISSVKCGKVE